MIDCSETQELLPWYVTGRLEASDADDVAAHLLSCEACRLDLANVVRLRHAVAPPPADTPAVRGRVWRAILAKAGLQRVADIDVGSLLVGLHLGLSARRSKAPVRASLRVLGRSVRIVPSRTSAPQKERQPHDG